MWLQDNIYATVFALVLLGLVISERGGRLRFFGALTSGLALGYLEYVKETAVLVFVPLGAWACYASWRARRVDRRVLYAGLGFAIVQIAVPGVVSERDRALYQQLAEGSTFNPRGHFEQELKNESRTH